MSQTPILDAEATLSLVKATKADAMTPLTPAQLELNRQIDYMKANGHFEAPADPNGAAVLALQAQLLAKTAEYDALVIVHDDYVAAHP